MELAEVIQSPYFDSFPEYLWVTWFNNFNQLSDFIDLENSGWVYTVSGNMQVIAVYQGIAVVNVISSTKQECNKAMKSTEQEKVLNRM